MIIKTFEIEYKNEYPTKHSNTRARSSDRNWQYCEKCRMIWEVVGGKLHRHKQQPFHISHQTCPECRDKLETDYRKPTWNRNKFDKETVVKIRAEYKNQDIIYADLMKKYNASQSLIYKVLNKRYPYNYDGE